MSSQRTLILGAVLGLVAVVLLLFYVRDTDAKPIVVYRLKPDVSLAKGQVVSKGQIEPFALPEEFSNILEFAVLADRESFELIEEKPVARDVPAGSLLQYEFFEERPDDRFTARVAPGMRAMTLPVDAASAVSFFVEPGSRVDVLAALEIETTTMHKVEGVPGTIQAPQFPVTERRLAAKTVLQNVRVLAVGRATTRGTYLGKMAADRPEFQNVTIEVTPLQAEKLVFAIEHTPPGRDVLTLTLRNPADDKIEDLPALAWDGFDRIE